MTNGLPAASTTAVLSPVATPAGSGFGPSSAKPIAVNPNNTPSVSTTATDFGYDRRRDRLSAPFVICRAPSHDWCIVTLCRQLVSIDASKDRIFRSPQPEPDCL